MSKNKIPVEVPYKLILVIWEDSQLGFQGWKVINDQPVQKPVYISVGFLVREDKETLYLFPHIENIKEKDSIAGSGDILIPRSAIKQIKQLPTSF